MHFFERIKGAYKRNRGLCIAQIMLSIVTACFALLILSYSITGLSSGKSMPAYMNWLLCGMLCSLGLSNVLTAIDMKLNDNRIYFHLMLWSGLFGIVMGILLVSL